MYSQLAVFTEVLLIRGVVVWDFAGARSLYHGTRQLLELSRSFCLCQGCCSSESDRIIGTLRAHHSTASGRTHTAWTSRLELVDVANFPPRTSDAFSANDVIHRAAPLTREPRTTYTLDVRKCSAGWSECRGYLAPQRCGHLGGQCGAVTASPYYCHYLASAVQMRPDILEVKMIGHRERSGADRL